ncbi:MAG: hypothetical protein A2007_04825 [Verrucomicrobia bacterium GWC2_42_7]|nr:MAG: hypothetical protein A2007_04825 [Verrucomicrobia bacterium GWC2_42_7]
MSNYTGRRENLFFSIKEKVFALPKRKAIIAQIKSNDFSFAKKENYICLCKLYGCKLFFIG